MSSSIATFDRRPRPGRRLAFILRPSCRTRRRRDRHLPQRAHGFSLTYPHGQFQPQEPLAEDGRIWVSRDGNARILAGALPNADNLTLQDYRALVLKQSYPGASVDYAPIRDNWFVLSGTRDGVMFYERVTFTCGGRLINSWAMLYPAAERRVYDRIVEQVSRSYRAGGSNCG